MFRTRDMGNLIQLIFCCGEYFRGKDIELITDSHFGHLDPIAYLRLYNVFATSSFNAGQRIGVSSIAELSKKALTKEEKAQLEEKQESLDEFDPLASSSDEELYCESKYKKLGRSVKTHYDYFLNQLSKRPKGEYRV